MKRTLVIIVLLAVGIVSVLVLDEQREEREPLVRSLLSLLLEPQKHRDDTISVFGYFKIGYKTQLYLVEEHAKFEYSVMAIRVLLNDDMVETVRQNCSDMYVEIKGKFNYSEEFQDPTITDIEHVMNIETGEFCR